MPRDDLYEEASRTFGAAIERLARSYEADSDRCRDLVQDIHVAIWRSLAKFERQCSLRTWVYRVAHNVAASHLLKQRRANRRALVSLEDAVEPQGPDPVANVDRQITLHRLHDLIQKLQAIDRTVILLYLEGLEGASIAEITGMSAGNVATKIHRIKKNLIHRFKGERDAD